MRLEEVSPYVVAVTGSIGKSTYLAYTSALLRQHMHICCPNGNFNTDVGVPLTVLSMQFAINTLEKVLLQRLTPLLLTLLKIS